MNKFSGFADEASADFDLQIKATQELGWNGIEVRMVKVGDKTMHFDDVDDATFEQLWAKLQAAGIGIPCYGSQIANWARKITNDFGVDVAELKRIMPRMKKTGTKFVRVMSYPNDNWEVKAWRDEAVRRLTELCRMAEDGGVILAHENCSGYGGQGYQQTLELLDAVKSPALQYIFDTGNPIEHHQDVFAFYKAVRSRIVHVHIKDYKFDSSPKGHSAVLPGDGEGQVRKVVADLKKTGYDAWYSMEPHIAAVIHSGTGITNNESAYQTYVKYGKQFEEIYRKA